MSGGQKGEQAKGAAPALPDTNRPKESVHAPSQDSRARQFGHSPDGGAGRGHPRPGPACAGSTGSAVTAPQDQIQCPRGYVCIYTEIHFEGRPHVSPARGSGRRTGRRSTQSSCAEREARRLRAEC